MRHRGIAICTGTKRVSWVPSPSWLVSLSPYGPTFPIRGTLTYVYDDTDRTVTVHGTVTDSPMTFTQVTTYDTDGWPVTEVTEATNPTLTVMFNYEILERETICP